VAALGVGAAALAAAAVVALLRRTRGVPPARRVHLITRLAGSAIWSVLPPRWGVVSVAAGALAFAGSLFAGLVVTLLVVLAIPPEVPHPTEAYEGIGDALMAMFYFGIGAMLSLCVAFSVGIAAGAHVASQWRRGAAPNRFPASTT
jgi:hypothetical protein